MLKNSNIINRIKFLVLSASIVVSAYCYGSYRRDQQQLETLARQITASVNNPHQQALSLLSWANQTGSSQRNSECFFVTSFRATPMQVAKTGGDCADKSRLLFALLRAIDIPATMAMCFDADTNKPAHTIIEARPSPNDKMVLDPAFGLYFPRLEGQGYYSLLDLRANPAIVPNRLRTLRQEDQSLAGTSDYYLASSSAYNTASTFNWNRNWVTKFVQSLLRPMLGESLYAMSRPAVMEEPKLALASLALLPGFMVTIATIVQRKRRKHAASDLIPKSQSSNELAFESLATSH